MKIITAREVPDIDDNGEVIGRELVVEVEINGVKTTVGGIDPKLSKQDILAYLESRRDEILANAEPAKYKAIERTELTTDPPRDLEAEVDGLKSRLTVLEEDKRSK